MSSRRLAAVAILSVYSTGALAEPMSGDRVLTSLTRCREAANPDARLACFDAAVLDLEKAVRAKDVTILDRLDIRKARRSLFGFTLPRIGLFGNGDDARGGRDRPEFEELNSTILTVRQVENGRLQLRLAEGDAVWVTTDPVAFPPKAGAKIRIRKGAIGNYFLAIEGIRSVRGMRVR